MRYMNEFDIEMAARQHALHPVLGPAIQTLSNLVVWTNSNSDGWAYWPKPCRSAAKLQELIEGDGTAYYRFDDFRQDATVEKYKAALKPIKSFRTRQGADFEIVEANS